MPLLSPTHPPQESVASKQREVEELIDRLAESAAAEAATEGRLRLQQAAAEAAMAEVGEVHPWGGNVHGGGKGCEDFGFSGGGSSME